MPGADDQADGLVVDLLNPQDSLPGVRAIRLFGRNRALVIAAAVLGFAGLVPVIDWADDFGGSPSYGDPYAGDVNAAPARPTRRSAYFEDCAQARAAFAVPLISSARAYRPGLDDDGDGVACEEGETGRSARG